MRWMNRVLGEHLSERKQTAVLFTAFLVSGAVALAAAFLILGSMITLASDVQHGALHVVAAGGLVGTLTAFVIHEIGIVLPGVMARLARS